MLKYRVIISFSNGKTEKMQPTSTGSQTAEFSVLYSFPFNSVRPQLFRVFNSQFPNHHRVVQSALKAQQDKRLTQLGGRGAALIDHLGCCARIGGVFPGSEALGQGIPG